MKNKFKNTFFKSIIILMTSQIIVKILSVFYKLYLTNRTGFGDEGNAIAGAAFQIYTLFLSITSVSIPSTLSKIIAEFLARGDHKNAHRFFKISMIIFSVVGMAGSYILVIGANIISKKYLNMPEAEKSIIALAPSIFLVSLSSVFRGYFAGRECMKINAKAQACDQFIKTIITVLMIEVSITITKKLDIEYMAMLVSLSTTIGNIVELGVSYIEYKKILPEIRQEKIESTNEYRCRVINILKKIMVISIPITLTTILLAISRCVDSVTIIHILTTKIGYKSAKMEYGILTGKVDALINLPLSFNMAITIALLPKIAGSNGNVEEIKRRIKQSLKIAVVIALPIVVIYLGMSECIMKLLFPKAPNGADLLRIEALTILLVSVEQIINVCLQGIGKTFQPLYSTAFGVVTKVILNLLLVPKVDFFIGGAKGAAFATLMCHFVTCFVSILQINKYLLRKIGKKEGF